MPVVLAMFVVNIARAVDYHVATVQDLQNALTLAANDGADNNIYVTNGYYTGNFNYNSANVNSKSGLLNKIGQVELQRSNCSWATHSRNRESWETRQGSSSNS